MIQKELKLLDIAIYYYRLYKIEIYYNLNYFIILHLLINQIYLYFKNNYLYLILYKK
jgi:hypothetical protein